MKTNWRLKNRRLRARVNLLLAILLAFGGMYVAPQTMTVRADSGPENIIYVTEYGSGEEDGSSWDNALPGTKLQDAIDGASAGTQIWVAAGTYTPTKEVGGTGERFHAFQLKNGVAIYGGFAGTESSLDERDPEANETILSGNLGEPNSNDDNAYHVVFNNAALDNSAVLDGFTIRDGNAAGAPDTSGAGMLTITGSPKLSNVRFTGNSSDLGGGMAIKGGSPSLENVTFIDNTAGQAGGIYISSTSPVTLTDVTIQNNKSNNEAGGLMLATNGNLTLIRGTVTGNEAQKNGGGMWLVGGNATIQDSSFSNNISKSTGGGLYSQTGTVTVENTSFTGNNASTNGGGLAVGYSTATLRNLEITGNKANTNGGGVYIGSAATLTDLTIAGNQANVGGGLYFQAGDSIVTNVLVSGNKASRGGGLAVNNANPTLTNVTIAGNSATSGGGGMFAVDDGTGTAILRNSIVWGNGTAVSGSRYSFAYSLIEGSGGSEDWDTSFGSNEGGNIDANPDFENARPTTEAPTTAGNYRLKDSSLAVDAGSDSVFQSGGTPDLSAITTDLEGEPRKQHAAVDMGAYELLDEITPTIIQYTPANGAEDVETDIDLELKFHEPVKPVAGKKITVMNSDDEAVANVDAADVQINGYTATIELPSELDEGETYYVTIEQGAFIDRADHELPAIEGKTAWTFQTRAPEPSIIHVTVLGSGDKDGTSWDNAYPGTKLQDAIDKAVAGSEVWVAAGTYTPTKKVGGTEDRHRAFRLKNGVAVYGGFPADPAPDTDMDDRDWTINPTILSGDLGVENDNSDNAYHVIHIPAGMEIDESAVLDGFTITGGNGGEQGVGGGILLESGSPTLRHLLIEGNEATMGGGMYIKNSSPDLEQVTFRQNKAGFFGGGVIVANGGHLDMSNGSIEDNEAVKSAGGLGNSVSDSVAVLKNVTISGNKASENGAGIYSSGTLKLEDVTIRDNSNTGALGGGLYQFGGDVTMTGVTLERNTANNGGAAMIGDAIATLNDVIVNQNTANSNGGGIVVSGSTTLTAMNLTFTGNEAMKGGALFFSSSTPGTLTNVLVSGNKATGDGGGVFLQAGRLNLSGGSFEDNEAGGNGGGLYVFKQANTVELKDVTISGNKASENGSGGGIYSEATLKLEDVTIKENNAGASGGGVYQVGKDVTMTRVTLEENAANSGGAISLVDATATLNDVTVKRNSALAGGGIAGLNSTTLTAMNSTFAGNEAMNGGALFLNSSMPGTLTNVLIIGNKATGNGGGLSNSDISPTLTNVTISGNAAANGGGLYSDSNNEIFVRNSIIWGNNAANGKNVSGPSGKLHFANSLIEGSGGSDEWNDAFGENLGGNIDADPLFADAKPAGEAPSTEGDYRLTDASPAVDAGDDGVFEDGAIPDLSEISTDLAGEPRKRYDAVDMGAYEFLDETAPSITDKTPASGAENVATDVKLVLKFDEPVKPVAGKMIKVWTSEDTVAADSVATAATVNGTTVTITLSSKLSNDTEYYVTIDQGAFVDRADHEVAAIADKTAWTFTTAAADDEPGDDQPGNEPPGDDEPGNEQPGDDEPGNEQPGDEEPGNEQPGDDEPGNEQPGDEEPGNEQPGDEEPGGGNPAPSQPTNPSQPASPSQPANPSPNGPAAGNTGVDVLVNGKAESAGIATMGTRNGQNMITITIDENRLEERLAEEGRGTVVTIPVNAGSEIVVGELNGQMVKAMEASEAVLEIRTDRAAYTLPALQINIDALSEQIGTEVELRDIKVQIEIAEPAAETVQAVESVAADGSFTLVVPPIEFTVRAVHGDTIIEVEKFTAYVERLVAIPEGADPERITTAVVVEPDGAVRHVPTRVELIDDRYYARVNSLTNSTYAVIWNPVEFADVADHWSKTAVNNMGSRKVIEGIGGGRFEPDRNVTRAEFAAIVVRALGLKPESGATPFTDVKESDWFAGAVLTAHAYGLITGLHDGTFLPDENITREQAMTVIARAMELTNLKAKLPEAADGEVPLAFADADQVSGWAKAAIADNVRAGIVTGRSGAELAPKASITRAEVAVMVERLLRQSGLI